MRIRLDVNVPSQAQYTFEHQGAAVRMGRDPEGELVFQGDACQCVSWNHACIELTTGGAFLSDLGSSNGTFVNDQRLAGRTPLRPGDHIRMGQTGPLLHVVDLQLAGPRVGPNAEVRARQLLHALEESDPALATNGSTKPAGGRLWEIVEGLRWPLLFVAGALMALFLVVLIVVLLRPFTRPPTTEAPLPTAPEIVPKLEEPKKTSSVEPPSPLPQDDPGKAQQVPKEKQPIEPPVLPVRTIGAYAAEKAPSVLLQRQRDPDPWGRLKPDGRIQPGYYLVSLPGYRSKIHLDSGIILVLWGNLPEFAPFPPLFESTIILEEPKDGLDLDVTLDHGRIHFYNNKPKEKGPARVRLRFLREVWDLTLPDFSSEVVVELWGMYPRGVPFSKEPGGRGPDAVMGMHTKGPVTLKAKDQTYTLTNPSRVVWTNRSPALMGPDQLPKLPEWWTNQLDATKDPAAGAMMVALVDLAATLAQKEEAVVDTVWNKVKDDDEPARRKLAVLCLGALDAVEQLADALEERSRPLVRTTAIHALRHWISRGPDYELELYRTLQDKKKYARDKAETIMQLLHDFSDADLHNPATFDRLIKLLDHDSLSVRELALWHLTQIAPQGLKIGYEATGDAEKRQQAIAEWRKLIPAGKLPPRPGPAAKP